MTKREQVYKRRKRLYTRIAGYMSCHDIAGARKVLESKKLKGATTFDIASLKASLFEFEGKQDAAKRVLAAAARQLPRDLRPWVELVELYRDGDERAKAKRLLRTLWRKVELGRYRGNRQRLIEALVEVEADSADSARDRSEAIAVCARALSRFPDSKPIRQWVKALIE